MKKLTVGIGFICIFGLHIAQAENSVISVKRVGQNYRVSENGKAGLRVGEREDGSRLDFSFLDESKKCFGALVSKWISFDSRLGNKVGDEGIETFRVMSKAPAGFSFFDITVSGFVPSEGDFLPTARATLLVRDGASLDQLVHMVTVSKSSIRVLSYEYDANSVYQARALFELSPQINFKATMPESSTYSDMTSGKFIAKDPGLQPLSADHIPNRPDPKNAYKNSVVSQQNRFRSYRILKSMTLMLPGEKAPVTLTF